MKQELISLLSSFKYPVYLQGSLTGSYPDSFFTIWNDDTNDGAHYDNNAITCIWDFTVYFYSVDPIKVNTVLDEIKRLLRSNGWIVGGKGRDVPTDEPSHTGRSLEVKFIEKN